MISLGKEININGAIILPSTMLDLLIITFNSHNNMN